MDFDGTQPADYVVDEEIDIGDCISVNGQTYRISMMAGDKSYAGIRKFTYNNPEKVDETDEADFTCPYCSYIYHDAFELPDQAPEGETTECPCCGSEITYERVISVSYVVSPVKQNTIKPYNVRRAV